MDQVLVWPSGHVSLAIGHETFILQVTTYECTQMKHTSTCPQGLISALQVPLHEIGSGHVRPAVGIPSFM